MLASNCLTVIGIKRCELVIALSLGGWSSVADANEYVRDLTKPKDASPLFHISHAGKLGFMDALGNTVIQPRFDDAGYFFDGLARVRVGKLWGFTNQAGQIVIPPHFEAAGDFREALAPVRVGKNWGYIGPNGRMLVAPAFQGAASFREGLARVETWSKVRCGGEKIRVNADAPASAFYIHSDFDYLMIELCLPVDSKFGYIDHAGHLVIPAHFAKAHEFFDGLALVRMDSTESGKYGFLDRTGALAIGFQFDAAHDFSEGLAAVLVGRRKVNGIRDPGSYGFIDRSGKFVIRDQFAEAGDFSEGLAPVAFWDRHGKGYIDKSGRLAIAAQYQAVESFSEGLAQACFEIEITSWRCIYIDHKARVAINSVQASYPFSGGLAIAETKGTAFYIDKKGRPIAPLEMGTKLPSVSNH